MNKNKILIVAGLAIVVIVVMAGVGFSSKYRKKGVHKNVLSTKHNTLTTTGNNRGIVMSSRDKNPNMPCIGGDCFYLTE